MDEAKLVAVPLNTSESTLPEMPETEPELVYCQKFQTPEPQS
jgi:hypothetical protein